MKRALLVVALLGSFAGCAAIIDLGDEPKLFPADAGSAAETSTPVVADAAPDADAEAGPVDPAFVCGLPDSPNTTCATCQQGKCCEANKACAADPTCIEGLECIKECLVNATCIDECQKDLPLLRAVTNCTLSGCLGECTPPNACARLGSCVFELPKGAIARTLAREVILKLDADACTAERQRVATEGDSDAGACF
ncbi:MAG: hypothetical protein KIT84_40540 [Labilithrix sp.]|nr:hypothetical protein [Labilithrix sp.]MCW5817357.1 hypothetical protein [Labilithrix sp.]